MVERFNGRISELLQQTRFDSQADLKTTLLNYLKLYNHHIAYLMRMGRTCPDLDAKLFFDPDEIQTAYLLNKALAPPAPRVNEVVRMIARIGRFLARKSKGEPGAKTIWEGLRDVRASAHTIKTLRELGLLSSCV
ncbi:hypothetical protein INH39_32285 [Massilia violaceinigra]|uniref:Transposase Tn5 dimerisation domain-containing protein n=2 Tax=Massilia violaceinigra TaxID=2045208 RepID=A0ABY4A5C6_9BURK|nr:hypothetical protein INH39_32285 [Massilia violaceinigra]